MVQEYSPQRAGSIKHIILETDPHLLEMFISLKAKKSAETEIKTNNPGKPRRYRNRPGADSRETRGGNREKRKIKMSTS